MGDHYTQKKEEKTLSLVKRACYFLVETIPPIKLNGKLYKKVNFSHGQVLDCMHHIATVEEKAEGILFNDPTTFTHNRRYKAEIANGKLLREEKETGKLSITFEDSEPDMLDMKLMIDSMAVQIDALKEKNASLEAIIKKADLREATEEKSGPINIDYDTSISEEQRVKEVLERLLVILSEEYMLAISPKENGKSSIARLILPDGERYLCSMNDLGGINYNLKKESNGRLVLEHKEVIEKKK